MREEENIIFVTVQKHDCIFQIIKLSNYSYLELQLTSWSGFDYISGGDFDVTDAPEVCTAQSILALFQGKIFRLKGLLIMWITLQNHSDLYSH
jgi:hypothetical protein